MAFVGILFYFFFFFIRPQDWLVPFKGFPVDDFLIPLILFACLPSLPRFREIIRLPQSKFLLFFIVAVFLSNITNGNIDATVEYGMKYIKFAIIFFTITLSLDSFGKLKWTIPYFLILVAFIAFQGIIQSKTGVNWAGQSLYWADRIRWVGIFDGANITALLFVLAMPFLFEFLLGPWGKSYKLLSILSIILLMTGFYLSNSRGGFLSLLAVIFSFIYSKVKNKKGIILGFVIVIALFTVAPSRMGEVDDSHKSTRGRIHEWEESLQMMRYHKPIFGVGKGQFLNYTSLVSHNAFLQQLGETGIIGAFFWVGLIFTPMVGLINILNKEDIEPFRRSIYRGYFIGFIGLLVGVLFISADMELIYIWIAFLTSIILIEGIELKFTIRDLILVGLIEVTSIVVFYIAVNLFKHIYF